MCQSFHRQVKQYRYTLYNEQGRGENVRLFFFNNNVYLAAVVKSITVLNSSLT